MPPPVLAGEEKAVSDGGRMGGSARLCPTASLVRRDPRNHRNPRPVPQIRRLPRLTELPNCSSEANRPVPTADIPIRSFPREARNSGWSVMETARIYAMRWKRLIPRELAKSTAHLRAQILYYLGENLAVRSRNLQNASHP